VTELRVVRTVRAPRHEVFDAWVDLDRLRAWWGPPGIEVVELEHDLRVGGSSRIVMDDRTEIEITHTGISDEAEAAMHEHGWSTCLDSLDVTLNRRV
jgi:activator of Hsp90 ATPase-like protein